MEKLSLYIDDSLCKECGIFVAEGLHHKNKFGHKHVDHDYELCDQKFGE